MQQEPSSVPNGDPQRLEPTSSTVATTDRARPRPRLDRRLSEQRQKAKQRGWFTRLPIALRVVLPLVVLAVAAFQGWEWWKGRHARLDLAVPDGLALPEDPAALGVRFEFFPWSDSGAAVSPPPRLGEVEWRGGVVWAGPDLVPGQALVRLTAPGFGADYAWAELGGPVTSVQLAPPRRATGQVVDAKQQPIGGARVIGFGGRQHGVPLAETTTDADGSFVLEGFAPAELLVRVLQPGFAVGEKVWFASEDPPVIELQATQPVRGRVVVPDELVSEGLAAPEQIVQAYKVPGAHAAVGADGSFVLDHLPPPPGIVRLVLPTLPEGWTHRRTVVEPGQEGVVLEVCRAGVIEGQVTWENRQPAGYASVLHEHGPTGNVSATCDADGWFRIERVPVGEVTLEAIVAPKPRRLAAPVIGLQGPTENRVRSGSTTVEMREGETRSGVAIRLQ